MFLFLAPENRDGKRSRAGKCRRIRRAASVHICIQSTFGHKETCIEKSWRKEWWQKEENINSRCACGGGLHRIAPPKQLAFIFYCFLFIFIIAHGAIFKSMISFNKTLIFFASSNETDIKYSGDLQSIADWPLQAKWAILADSIF